MLTARPPTERIHTSCRWHAVCVLYGAPRFAYRLQTLMAQFPMRSILSRSLITCLFCVIGSAQQTITPLDGPLPYDDAMSRQGDKTYVVRIVDGDSAGDDG